MNRHIARTAAFALFNLAAVQLGLACSCSSARPVCAAYWTTSTLFLGHVIRIDHIFDKPPEEVLINGRKETLIGPGQYLVHFSVTQTYRGALSKEIVVRTADQGSACGYDFKEGHDYLVYASISAYGDVSTNHCTRTHEVTSGDEDPDIHWIDSLQKAPPGATIFGSVVSGRTSQGGTYETTPLGGVAVTITGPETKTVSSDSTGKFRADGLAPGKYVVSAASSPGYTPFPSSTVTLQNHSCAELPWTTRLDGHIKGHVYFHDGKPAMGINLTARAANARPHEPWTWHDSHVQSASDGSFDFAPLDPGTYIIAANIDFPGQDGGYYRKAFYSGSIRQSEAAIIALSAGQTVDNLRFYLPPDSSAPTIPIEVTILGFDGKPAPHANILAFDDIWESSVTSIATQADENGQATITLRAGSHYDIEAYVTVGFKQSCAEPIGIDVNGQPAPLVLVVSHHLGNCMQFKKPRAESR